MGRVMVPYVLNHSWFCVAALAANHTCSCESHQDMAILESIVFHLWYCCTDSHTKKEFCQDSFHTRGVVLLYSSVVPAMDPQHCLAVF